MPLINASTILDYLDSSIICLSSDLQIKQVNSTAEVFFDNSSKALVEKPFSSLFDQRFENSILESLQFCLEHNHQITEHEASLTLANGKTIVSDYSIHPIKDVERLNLLIEIRPFDRHLEIARDGQRVAQQLASQQLARGMAHEIKNPLGGIRGAAQLLESEISNDELKEYTEVIIREADRLQNLLNNMLGPNKKIDRKPINILEILEHVHSLIAAEFNDLVVVCDYDPSIPDLRADRDQMVQAFLNIARNAAQAIDGDGEITFKTRICRQHTIGYRRCKHVVQIDIIDQGPGIAPELLENIFLPMVTDKADGTGLGLPIAQKIIVQHDGIIQCRSEPGQTVFTTLLPLD